MPNLLDGIIMGAKFGYASQIGILQWIDVGCVRQHCELAVQVQLVLVPKICYC